MIPGRRSKKKNLGIFISHRFLPSLGFLNYPEHVAQRYKRENFDLLRSILFLRIFFELYKVCEKKPVHSVSFIFIFSSFQSIDPSLELRYGHFGHDFCLSFVLFTALL